MTGTIDEIGYWSEVKLDIVREYAAAYSKILAKQADRGLYHIYIDAFAGSGVHISRSTKDFVAGSPLNALLIDPPFREYHLIDLDQKKISILEEIVGTRENVYIYKADCNQVLLDKIFPRVQYKDYRRGLCLLDPYGLHLNWEVIQQAGSLGTLEIFLNFPVADINRNVLPRDPDKVDNHQMERMDVYWGDRSWWEAAYKPQPTLFGEMEEKTTNEALAQAFQARLVDVAGFKYVPNPLPMRNINNAVIYYLFFASQNKTGEKIVEDIFKKYSQRRAV